MDPRKRRDLVKQRVVEEGKVEIEELAQQLNVSSMTIRRDLVQLEEEGFVIRTHGGAVLPKPLVTEMPFLAKEGQQIEQKRQVAKKAIPLIMEGQTILLDSGTTTLEIARHLKRMSTLTVITNDIKIAAELLDSKLKVIVTGGELQNDVGALFGPQTYQVLQSIHVDVFFLGAHAIDIDAGIMSPTFEKSAVKQMMIASAEKTWVVADSSKLNRKAFSKVCGFNQLAGLITDDEITEQTRRLFADVIDIY